MRILVTFVFCAVLALLSMFVTEAQVRVGTMINAYSCQSRFTNQIAYDWEHYAYSVLVRGGPIENYPDEGMGSLVLASSKNLAVWKQDTGIFNSGTPSNLHGKTYTARHPNIIAWPSGITTGAAALWGQLTATQMFQDGILGEMAYKSGTINGPFSTGVLQTNDFMPYFPSRIVRSNSGMMYSLFQSRETNTGNYTGSFYLLKSTDAGTTWNVTPTPALVRTALPSGYTLSEEALSFDVSPDGNVLYAGFVAYVPVPDTAQVTDTYFGWVRSTDQGAAWTEPLLYRLADCIVHISGLSTVTGWIYPSIGPVVDGLNQPHFLCTIQGKPENFVTDSAYVGEFIIDPLNLNAPPIFKDIATHRLPEFHRMINPAGSQTGPQPVFIIRGEHEWSKSPDGMKLIAKWLDADSVWKTAPAGYPHAFVRDTAHDVYTAYAGWVDRYPWGAVWVQSEMSLVAIANMTQSPDTDEKFTKIPPVFGDWSDSYTPLGMIYTIMAGADWPPNAIQDIDDQGPAELYFIIRSVRTGVQNAPPAIGGLALSQNYPNPFNPSTTIRFVVDNAGYATIKVFSLLGELVGTAFDGFVDAGVHSTSFNATDLPGGQYFYRLECNGSTASRLMTLIK